MSQNRFFKVLGALFGSMILAIGTCYALVSANANGRLYDAVDEVPYCRYGLLFKSKKIDRIIASGGDYADGCNELTAIRDSLVMKGVPADSIVLDYQGTRTVNSIVRAKELTDSVTLISQKYHNERALYLADHHGLYARAYNAETPKLIGKKIKNISREFLARVKMMIIDI